jgi:hypothetical protein
VYRSTRSGRILPSATPASVPRLRWSAWVSTTTSASSGLRVRFDISLRCWNTNRWALSCSQQAPQQRKDGDFCTACLTGVCLCCCAEGGWPCGLRPHHVLTTTHRLTCGQNSARVCSDLSERIILRSSLPLILMLLYMFDENMTWTIPKVTMNYESRSRPVAETSTALCRCHRASALR